MAAMAGTGWHGMIVEFPVSPRNFYPLTKLLSYCWAPRNRTDGLRPFPDWGASLGTHSAFYSTEVVTLLAAATTDVTIR
jgi:hypothetical protein